MTGKKVTEKFLVEFDKQAKKHKLSQNKLAIEIGYKSGGANITNMRNGPTEVQIENLIAFANKFGYELNFFLEDAPEGNTKAQEQSNEPKKAVNTEVMQLINNQLSTLESATKTLEQLFNTGLKFTEVQQSSIDMVKNLINN
ncbi:helix-turn-helix domain-containing protein [Elizabethkingia anophelis]|uniref:helix-turn-helix domain-containing protein n=1 Tax=Elizabethkingia anophelis TaxID=1117645 RepID=UPI002226DA8D|nr:helix-turn-helix transcriptional regulator [Elizabethkingia anophelis]MCW2463391.1 transcriptional regulator with XRE-family HTH domain [Elizabethkingia anophelis]MCW2467076.1 transcriptional regulator with XRE-family HTH domain [Elizabethkingia anophelis]MCW2470776.1 transcriptional regulator with XRE-family HTH domain [Elizabethkingia anophelis]HBI9690650.1 helix-turn-helix transcriptional regulator [Elizabethkingia anophelis]HBI9694669.1 helix-turn-helix transcriptional regulator [Elizab